MKLRTEMKVISKVMEVEANTAEVFQCMFNSALTPESDWPTITKKCLDWIEVTLDDVDDYETAKVNFDEIKSIIRRSGLL